jgi:hypothetical protein
MGNSLVVPHWSVYELIDQIRNNPKPTNKDIEHNDWMRYELGYVTEHLHKSEANLKG